MAGTRHRGLSLAAAAALNGTSARPATGPRPGFTAPTGSAADDWRNKAACVNEDPELFFPIGNTGPALLQIEDAKAVCRRCFAIEACLMFALDSGIDQGVFGGMSEDERRALKRRAARQRSRGGEA